VKKWGDFIFSFAFDFEGKKQQKNNKKKGGDFPLYIRKVVEREIEIRRGSRERRQLHTHIYI